MHVLLYYKYIDVPDAEQETIRHRAVAQSLGLRGRIFISTEGLNGTCSGTKENIEKYKQALNAHPLFCGIVFKESLADGHPFKKLFVRLRPEVVTLRQEVSAKQAAPYISPEDLHAALERDEDLVLIDMRNDYEAAIGRFRNAKTLTMKNFRDLPKFLAELEPFKHKSVVTYCTGGIRCERASALLQQHGFTNVRQLEGGIVVYCEKFPDGFFEGSCFVFDDRMTLRFPGKKPQRFISQCGFCKSPCDRYLDCAHQPCHDLFLCCEECEPTCGGYCKIHAVKPLAVLIP
ncbi:rhodanese-related sulfurtransferase [Candidatus Peribacteria bacterium]|nr:rhodanese-related sulfurtransferase [Candidatus Peribacteria bacterium]